MPPQDMNTPPVSSQNGEVPQAATPVAEEPAKDKTSMGPVIGAVIIVLVLILGGLYFWGENLNTAVPQEEAATSIEKTGDPSTEALEQQGTSDALSDIEYDLKATDLSEIDREAKGLRETFE